MYKAGLRTEVSKYLDINKYLLILSQASQYIKACFFAFKNKIWTGS